MSASYNVSVVLSKCCLTPGAAHIAQSLAPTKPPAGANYNSAYCSRKRGMKLTMLCPS